MIGLKGALRVRQAIVDAFHVPGFWRPGRVLALFRQIPAIKNMDIDSVDTIDDEYIFSYSLRWWVRLVPGLTAAVETFMSDLMKDTTPRHVSAFIKRK